MHEEAQRLQEWVQFGEATVLADAQCRVEAALAELERCRSVAAMQRCRIAEVKALASGLARREGQLAELCQDLIKLSELAALAQGHKG